MAPPNGFDSDPGDTTVARGTRLAFIGVLLMGGSLPLWPLLLAVPFLPLTVATRGVVATTIVVIAEIAFWMGAALAGPAAARRVRGWLRWNRNEPRPDVD